MHFCTSCAFALARRVSGRAEEHATRWPIEATSQAFELALKAVGGISNTLKTESVEESALESLLLKVSGLALSAPLGQLQIILRRLLNNAHLNVHPSNRNE